jgi:hypothetical protein
MRITSFLLHRALIALGIYLPHDCSIETVDLEPRADEIWSQERTTKNCSAMPRLRGVYARYLCFGSLISIVCLFGNLIPSENNLCV